MGLVQSIPPSKLPLTLNEVKAHLRVEHTHEDDLITSYLGAATKYAEDFTGRQFMPATWKQTLERFPANGGSIEINRPPLRSITKIEFIDTSGITQELNLSEDVIIDDTSLFAQVHPAWGTSWPATRNLGRGIQATNAAAPQVAPAVTIIFEAGYPDGDGDPPPVLVPDSIKSALRILVAHLYENREPVVTGTIVSSIPTSVDSLLWMERVMRAA